MYLGEDGWEEMAVFEEEEADEGEEDEFSGGWLCW